MNVYRVTVRSNKDSEGNTWLLPGSRPRTAIGRALENTVHENAQVIFISCELVEAGINIPWKTWLENYNKEET